MSDKPIIRPGDLPTKPKNYQRMWQQCADAYIASRLFHSIEAARDAAFEDVRKLYWEDEKAEYQRKRQKPRF